MSGKSRDYFTTFRAAGKHISANGEGTAFCLLPQQPNETPLHIKKYRKSFKQQHGVSILHHGLVDAPKQPNNFVYGKKTAESDKVGKLLDIKKEGINELIEDIHEKKYASRQKEPLGAMPTRNYNWPQETQQSNFQFGQKIPPSEYTAKEVVLPPDATRDTEENRLMYLRSHGNYEAGEQKNRNYSWGIDTNQHRFGKKDRRELNQMGKIVQQEQQHDEFPKTVILKKNQANWKDYNEDPIGQPKNLAQVNGYVTSDTVFGVVKNKEEWSAGQCIRGEATWKEVDPDTDLGKATKSGFKNQTKSGDENRIFGVATIRNDIKKKGMKSVADPQNYGDEKPAIALLLPEKFSHMGLEESDFTKLRPKLEVNEKNIRDIFESVGIKYGNGKFEGVFARAKEIQGVEENEVSISSFQLAVLEMHHIE